MAGRHIYIVLRGHWCDSINRNSRAPTKDKRDDKENGFCRKLQQAFKQLTNYDMKYLLGVSIVKTTGCIISQIC